MGRNISDGDSLDKKFVRVGTVHVSRMMVSASVVYRFNSVNAELSPMTSWRGPRSKEVGEEGEYT